jgi:hypothetical protein
MRWRDWVFACSLAAVVGVGVGAVQANVAGYDHAARHATSRSGTSVASATSSTEGLPPPQEQGRTPTTTRPAARSVTTSAIDSAGVEPQPAKQRQEFEADQGENGQAGDGHKGRQRGHGEPHQGQQG